MTTAIIHGDPGSRKTATLVGLYGIPALYSGRTVVSNIRGFNDIKKIEQAYGKPIPEEAKLITVPFTRDGFKRMGNFFHWAPSGALILMDEGQRVYPTRLRNLNFYDCNPPRKTGFIDDSTGVEEDIETVEEAFDCHRHMNWDIYISTPNIEKVHKEIRQVAEFGYRQKDLATVSKILAFLLGDFKRVKHNAENKGIAQGQAISQTNHRIHKRVFKCYQSTATGVAKGTHTKTSLFSQPKLLFVILLVGYAIYNFTSTYLTYGSFFPGNSKIMEVNNKDSDTGKVFATNLSDDSLGNQENIDSDIGIAAGNVSFGPVDKKLSLNVLSKLHSYAATVVTDGVPVHYIELKDEDGYVTLNSNELKQIGIRISPYDNFVIAHYGNNQKLIRTVYTEPEKEKEDILLFGTPLETQTN